MHMCIQYDPGEPTSWKVALERIERDWWLKFITTEFNNFITNWYQRRKQLIVEENQFLPNLVYL